MNIFVQIFCEHMNSISLVYTSIVGIAKSEADICSTLQDVVKSFIKVVIPFMLLPANVWKFWLLYIFTNIWCYQSVFNINYSYVYVIASHWILIYISLMYKDAGTFSWELVICISSFVNCLHEFFLYSKFFLLSLYYWVIGSIYILWM